MLRVLYLLLRQALLRRHPAAAHAALAPLPQRSGKRIMLIATLGALAIALTLAFHLRRSSHPNLRASPGYATVQLRVDALASTPLVVYLSGEVKTPATGGGAPSGEQMQSLPPTTQQVRIISLNNTFHPTFQVAPIASSIEVSNDDTIAHNTHVFDGERTLFNVALPRSGVYVHKLLGRAGIFDVRCDFHPWMRAWIFVPPAHAHHASVWKPGTVTLPNIAPGSYQLHTWTPAEGEHTQALVLAAGQVKALRLADP